VSFEPVIVANFPSPPGYVANKDSMGGFGQLYPRGAPAFPPLDLVYLASYLAERGVRVEVLESLGLALDTPRLLARIASSCAGARSGLVVVRTSAPTLDWDLGICGELKARGIAARIAVYGPVVSQVLARIGRERAVDYIVEGEPDETVAELARGVPEGDIAGLTYRRGADRVRNASRPLLKDLDALPFPKWELLPYRTYQLPRSSRTAAAELWLPMLASRGCPAGCHYCPYPVGQGVAWRIRSPKNVVDEMEHLVKDLGVDYILFRDPIFSLNQRRVEEICAEIVRRRLQVQWRCETRVDCLSEETLRAMAAAGCRGLNFGVESAEVEIQSNVGRKPITPQRFLETIALCHRLGIRTFGFFIIGLPGDTVATILETIRFAIALRANWVQFTAAAPFIGTKLRDWAVARGLATPDEYAYVSSHLTTMGNENLSKEQIQSLLRFAQFLQNYVINRKGILKDATRRDLVYRGAKAVADVTSDVVARTTFALGRRRFERWMNAPVAR
jgi:anaerobic magnesium-protoporphyrin IX monomethyl ester cyclase